MDPQILQLQQDLLTLKIDPGPTDGVNGSLTRGGAHTAAQRLGLVDFTGGAIPTKLILDIHAAAELCRQPIGQPLNYLDVSSDSAPGWREGYRPYGDVDGITLHQTGAPMTDVSAAEFAFYKANQEFSKKDTPQLMRWAKHNISATQEPHYVSLKTHYGITYSGKILQIHPLELWGWSAQSFSKHTISIEIAGFFEGIDGNPKTRPGGPAGWQTQRATQAQIDAAKNLIRYLYAFFKQNGKGLKFIFAHRMATNDRTPDPGSRVWKEVALPMLSELKLSDGGPGYVKGKGQPICVDWDPSRTAYHY